MYVPRYGPPALAGEEQNSAFSQQHLLSVRSFDDGSDSRVELQAGLQ